MKKPSRKKLNKYINNLELALKIIRTWAACDNMSSESRSKAMNDIQELCIDALLHAPEIEEIKKKK